MSPWQCSSVAAVDHGKVVDTSMGFTPLDGFMMGTRSGGVDPSVVTFIMKKLNLTPDEMDNILNKQSGLNAISGISSDDRDICAAQNAGNERAILAHEMQAYEIAKYIGSYIAAMNGVDAIVFTGGIGENGFGFVQRFVHTSVIWAYILMKLSTKQQLRVLRLNLQNLTIK